MSMTLKAGDKIWFAGEKRPYTIQACDRNFLICTKPFNLKHTVQYTIVSFLHNIRGADNYWRSGGYFDYSKREECEKALRALNGDTEEGIVYEISHRNYVELKIIRHESRDER